ncbi:MAG: hypothetical protein Q6L50_02480 [Gloeomargarita sp. GMQP_bins_120]
MLLVINRLLYIVGRLFAWVGQVLGAILTILLVRPLGLVVRLFRPGQSGQDQTFFLDPEEAKSLGKRSESPVATPQSPAAIATSPVMASATSAAGTPAVTGERRRPGPNMRLYLDMAKQMRRA